MLSPACTRKQRAGWRPNPLCPGVALGWLLAGLLAGCVPQQMQRQAKYLPFGEAKLFADGSAMRPLVPGTVPYGRQRVYAVDRIASGPATAGRVGPDDRSGPTSAQGAAGARIAYDVPPPRLDRELLDTGRQRFTIYCAPCHGGLGLGDGIIVQHGFPKPPSYAIDRLRAAPDGHFYAVITHGYGAMYPYAARVSPAERWAIIAYIRALQLSAHATLADVPPDALASLQGGSP